MSAPLDEDGSSTYRRDETLWFDDGSIILIAEEHGFRVHRSILSRQSTVLRDMFASLQPDEEHGCPVVTLPDEATDLCNLLSMIYNRRFGDDTWRSEYSTYDQELDVATGVVFLANKYGMDRLYCETISWLRVIFPTKFQQFEPGSRFRHTVLARPKGGGPACLIVRLINVARSSQTPELTAMLPFLLYLGAQLDVVELLNGSPRTDGTMERLQPRDIKICVEGKVALIAANSSATRCFLAGEGNLGSACRSRGACYMLHVHVSGSWGRVEGGFLRELGSAARCDPIVEAKELQWATL